ncbi:unnamed protein product [Paramecium octaurelia]|uniref:Uncharacterized protein n=1 Tax=Paramecium octaurelia TaxID=43137 RepID=A0A8S1T1C1_PAROT|nr:unnamed protein product [Paramecium octaurelia]
MSHSQYIIQKQVQLGQQDQSFLVSNQLPQTQLDYNISNSNQEQSVYRYHFYNYLRMTQ